MPKVMYAITGTIETRSFGSGVIEWSGTRQVPTFYLDADVQGITDAAHAVRIAATVVDPLSQIRPGRIHLHAEPVTLFPAFPFEPITDED